MEENALPVENHYVDLDFQEMDRDGTLQGKKLNLKGILEKPTTGPQARDPKKILVTGHVGSGKTAMLTKMAYDWAEEETYLSRFKLLLVFRIRDLDSEQMNLEEALLNSLESYVDEELKPHLRRSLRKHSKDILLLLDGYDECTDEVQLKSVQEVLSNRVIFRSSTIIVTSRPLSSTNINRYFEKHIQIRSLSEENAIVFIKKRFSFDPTKMEHVLKYLQKNLSLKASPITLYLFCFVFEEKGIPERVDGDFESPLGDVIKILGDRCCKREDSLNDVTAEVMWIYFGLLGKLFYACLKNKRIIVTQSELEKEFPEQRERTFIIKCGVLRQVNSQYRLKVKEYEPTHKAFMDYLVMSWLHHYLLPELGPVEFIKDHIPKLFDLQLSIFKDEIRIIINILSGLGLRMRKGLNEFGVSVVMSDEVFWETRKKYPGYVYELVPCIIEEDVANNCDSLQPVIQLGDSKDTFLIKLFYSLQLFFRNIDSIKTTYSVRFHKPNSSELATYEEIPSPENYAIKLIKLTSPRIRMSWDELIRATSSIFELVTNKALPINPPNGDYPLELNGKQLLTDLMICLTQNKFSRSVLLEFDSKTHDYSYIFIFNKSKNKFFLIFEKRPEEVLIIEVKEEELMAKNAMMLEKIIKFEDEIGKEKNIQKWFSLIEENNEEIFKCFYHLNLEGDLLDWLSYQLEEFREFREQENDFIPDDKILRFAVLKVE